MGENSQIRLPDRRIQQLHVKINQAKISSVSPSKVAALRGDPSTHSSFFLARLFHIDCYRPLRMTGRGKIEKPSPHGEGGEHSEPDSVLAV